MEMTRLHDETTSTNNEWEHDNALCTIKAFRYLMLSNFVSYRYIAFPALQNKS